MPINDDTVIVNLKGMDDGEKKPYLTFIWGPRTGEIVSLDREVTSVGRSPDCHLWIEDGSISRKHFTVEFKGNDIILHDLGSTNGTLINGERLDKKVLEEGDKIQISRETIFQFNWLDDTRRISEEKRYEMGVLDPVTGIYNRRYFLSRLFEEFSFARRKEQPLSLIMFDIDHFKKVNDEYGHLAGDFVLQKLAGIVAKTIRFHDILSRYGGEEFVILMRDASCQNSVNLAERIRRIVEETSFVFEGRRIPVAISCGIASVDADMKTDRDLIAKADHYLYTAKNSGRNRVAGPCLPEVC